MSIGVVRRQMGAPLAVAVVTFLLVLLLWMSTHWNGGVAAALDRGKTPVAPGVALESLNASGSIKLQTYGGRVIVVNFWASWCGPCRSEAAALNSAWQRWRSHLVTFVGVTPAMRRGTGDRSRTAPTSRIRSVTTALDGRRGRTASEFCRRRS